MIALRHQLLKKYLRANARGELLDEQSLQRPARRDHSFKLVGSTAYRPDVAGPDRVCFEIRDCHRDPARLQGRIHRILFYWSRSRADFAAFAEVPPFDSAAAFAGLPPVLQEGLKKACPSRIPPAALEFEKARFTYEVYRNFSYPLRDWRPWLELLGGDGDRLQAAQGAYLERLSEALAGPSVSVQARLQGALARFPFDSGLFALFRAQERRLAAP
jgi:hypothetical protein